MQFRFKGSGHKWSDIKDSDTPYQTKRSHISLPQPKISDNFLQIRDTASLLKISCKRSSSRLKLGLPGNVSITEQM